VLLRRAPLRQARFRPLGNEKIGRHAWTDSVMRKRHWDRIIPSLSWNEFTRVAGDLPGSRLDDQRAGRPFPDRQIPNRRLGNTESCFVR
jgi:hypothetical protein